MRLVLYIVRIPQCSVVRGKTWDNHFFLKCPIRIWTTYISQFKCSPKHAKNLSAVNHRVYNKHSNSTSKYPNWIHGKFWQTIFVKEAHFKITRFHFDIHRWLRVSNLQPKFITKNKNQPPLAQRVQSARLSWKEQ